MNKLSADERGRRELIDRLRFHEERDATKTTKATAFEAGNADNTFILWSTIFGCIVASTASFALGFTYSPHLRGSTSDADFWFLIQSGITQIVGLVVSGLLEYQRGDLPHWRWALPTGIAALCALIAVPLYVLAPTEWSTFLSQVASATQSFMVCQHFLSRRTSG